MSDTYRCAMCSGEFEKGWDDEAAEAEYRAAFPNSAAADEPREVVCDDCYNLMLAQDPPGSWEADQLTMYREQNGHEWPNCTTPDCEHKCCDWAGTGLCHPCSVQLLGRAEVDRRYAATHDGDGYWTGGAALPEKP